MSTQVVKISFQNVFRRFEASTESFADLRQSIAETLQLDETKVALRYIDEEGDAIVFDSTEELKEALLQLKPDSIFRIEVQVLIEPRATPITKETAEVKPTTAVATKAMVSNVANEKPLQKQQSKELKLAKKQLKVELKKDVKNQKAKKWQLKQQEKTAFVKAKMSGRAAVQSCKQELQSLRVEIQTLDGAHGNPDTAARRKQLRQQIIVARTALKDAQDALKLVNQFWKSQSQPVNNNTELVEDSPESNEIVFDLKQARTAWIQKKQAQRANIQSCQARVKALRLEIQALGNSQEDKLCRVELRKAIVDARAKVQAAQAAFNKINQDWKAKQAAHKAMCENQKNVDVSNNKALPNKQQLLKLAKARFQNNGVAVEFIDVGEMRRLKSIDGAFPQRRRALVAQGIRPLMPAFIRRLMALPSLAAVYRRIDNKSKNLLIKGEGDVTSLPLLDAQVTRAQILAKEQQIKQLRFELNAMRKQFKQDLASSIDEKNNTAAAAAAADNNNNVDDVDEFVVISTASMAV